MKSKRWYSVPQCAFNKNASMHTFPRDSHLRKQLITACKIGKKVTSNMFVCGDHFLLQDFFPSSLNCKRRVLKLGSIPTQNLPKRKFDKVLSLEEKKKIKERSDRLKNRELKKNLRSENSCSATDNHWKITNNSSEMDFENSAPESIQKCNDNVESSQNKDVDNYQMDYENDMSNNDKNDDDEHAELLQENTCPCNLTKDEHTESDNEENEESLEISAAKTLVEMHEKVIILKKQFEISKNSNVMLSEMFNEEETVVSNLITSGEKICHAIHNKQNLTLTMLLKTDDEMKCFTGIDLQLLKNLVEAVKDAEGEECNSYECSVENRIILCLCKLKLNLSFKCLAVLFHISRQTCSNLFLITLNTLAFILEDAIYWPTKEEILKNMPKCFANFKNTVIILDCTEIPVERPKCLYCKLRLYSHYKGCETVKFCIGCSPSGAIIYCSKPFGGRASDKAIFNKSGILQKLMPTRDAIMVDKGFAIENECLEARVQLIMPPKLVQKQQFTPQEVRRTKKIAAARVHIERVIQRIKLFQIFKGKISSKIAPYMEEISKVICGLVNLSKPILKDNKF